VPRACVQQSIAMGLGAAMISSLSIAAVMHMEEPESANATRPHLVMMVVDDLGWTDVGYHGGSFPTPNMDKLAGEGVKLDKYYVQQVCSPTRSALMTARYPFHTGLQHTTTLAPGSHAAIPKDTSTIAEVLKNAGYATHAIGKWHLGYASWEDTPLGRGFDSYAGYLQGAEDYYTHQFGFKGLTGYDLWRNKTVAWDVNGSHSTAFFMDEAKRVLDHHDAAMPMFMYFAHQEIHAPVEQPPDSASRQACIRNNITSPLGPEVTALRQRLCAMASNVDTAIGTFVDMLKAKGMWENTLLWLTTDNGGMTYGDHADGLPPIAVSASSNWPLRGGKGTLFEGGVRGLSFVSGGLVPVAARGMTRTGLMQHVDIPATMAAMAGADWLGGTPDGFDMWDAIVKGTPSMRSEVPINVDTCVGLTGGRPCARHSMYNALIASSGWKFIEANWYPHGCPNTTWCTGAGLYDGWYTIEPYTRVEYNASTQGSVPVSGLSKGGIWLFDLTADPNEEKNVAASNPAMVVKMRARLAALADPKQGYRTPQLNIPNPLSLPILHNGTWAPYKKWGQELPPMADEEINKIAAEWANAYWD